MTQEREAVVRLFDAAAFGLELRLAMARANLSLRQLSAIIHVDQASIHRVAKHGRPPCVETYLRLRRWIDEVSRGEHIQKGQSDE